MDEEEFKRLLEGAVGTLSAQAPQAEAVSETPPPSEAVQEAPSEPVEDPNAPFKGAVQYPDGRWGPNPNQASQGLGDPTSLDAITGGALKSVFETKDFFFGDTSADAKSSFRKNVEQTVDNRRKESIIDGFASGISQFAVGMIGLGKIGWLRKVGESGKAAKAGVEVAKAATVGAVSFNPEEERLSNLIQSTPFANPINAWLAADPSDSRAEGRVKAALESIGLDAAILGVTMATLKAFKFAKAGNTKAADETLASLQKEAEASTASKPVETPEVVPTQSVSTPDKPVIAENMTDGAQQVGLKPDGSEAPVVRPLIEVDVEDTEAILKSMKADADAIAEHGGWYQALESGHTFGQGKGVPYNKFSTDLDVDNFVARIADQLEQQLDKVKGGDVLSDSKVREQLSQRVRAFNEDPAAVIGMIQSSGKQAKRMVADAEAGFVVSQRMFQDSEAMIKRIAMGDYTAYGSREAAIDAAKSMFSMGASVYGATRSMVAAGARTVRQQRFRVDPALVKRLTDLDGESFVKAIQSTDGSPSGMRKLASNPSLLTKIVDHAQFLYLNNLLSGPKTHFINTASNITMLGMRPVERMIGATGQMVRGDVQGGSQLFMEQVRQFKYMGSSFRDSWNNAVEAFLRNDSVMAPQRTELYYKPDTVKVLERGQGYKPLTSLSNLMYNTYLTAMTAHSAPSTRTLGMMDELVKQTVYRSKLQASAHSDAVLKAAESGLEGQAKSKFIKEYVSEALSRGFDDKGRALNPQALHEAQIATFQNELLPGTLGRNVQTFVANTPASKFVLPFVKTPTNILRYGWKMTPGLNLLQREFRQSINGELGKEIQAQAMGQMALGMTFLGMTASMVANGSVTGGGPSDFKALAQLKATGWQPYSKVIVHEDGSKTFIPFGRYDPMAIPMGIVADLQDFIHALGDDDAENEGVGEAIGALFIALTKQFTSKTYMTGLKSFVDALDDADRNLGKTAKDMASNFIPFSSAMRQMNPDPYLREARDLTDKLKATIPGLSETVPAKYDAWGDPIYARRGLWSTDDGNYVDAEIQRLVIENGETIVTPQPVHNGVDLRDLTMSDGTNAYETYQKLSGRPTDRSRPLKEVVGKLMKSRAYLRAPDGDIGTRGTKLWLLHTPVSRYRSAALKKLKADPVVQEAFTKKTLKVVDQYRQMNTESKQKGLSDVGKAFGQDLK